jgi:DNA-binding NarL/FixJ family response regulator
MAGSAAGAADLRLVPALAEPAPARGADAPSGSARSGVSAVPAAIRTLIVDSHRLVRAGIRALVEDQPDLTVAGEAANGEDAVALARRMRPDVVVMDAGLGGVDVLQAIRQILAAPGQVNVLLLMNSETDECIFEALHAGARGLLVKDSDSCELLHAVRVVASGEALLSPRLMRRVINRFVSLVPSPGPAPDELAELTAREREVMALVAGGLSNEEIADRLVISPATAKTHVSRALRKLDARDRAQLVGLAYETGLVVSRCA